MSTPLDLLHPPPPPLMSLNPQAASTPSSGSHGSYGPFIAVIILITFFTIVAIMIGRLCSGRTIMGFGHQYDFEGWIERKCSTCIDGRIDVVPTQQQQADSVQVAIPIDNSPQVAEQCSQAPSSSTS
ncbi:hypothetical protein ACHQM5_023711 [Ranunculus cassubicifolius]